MHEDKSYNVSLFTVFFNRPKGYLSFLWGGEILPSVNITVTVQGRFNDLAVVGLGIFGARERLGISFEGDQECPRVSDTMTYLRFTEFLSHVVEHGSSPSFL